MIPLMTLIRKKVLLLPWQVCRVVALVCGQSVLGRRQSRRWWRLQQRIPGRQGRCRAVRLRIPCRQRQRDVLRCPGCAILRGVLVSHQLPLCSPWLAQAMLAIEEPWLLGLAHYRLGWHALERVFWWGASVLHALQTMLAGRWPLSLVEVTGTGGILVEVTGLWWGEGSTGYGWVGFHTTGSQ